MFPSGTASGAPDVGQRVGILEFDLSGITEEITSASMSLFSLSSSAAGEVFEQNAELLDLAVAPPTWNDYDAAEHLRSRHSGTTAWRPTPLGASTSTATPPRRPTWPRIETPRLAGGKLVFASWPIRRTSRIRGSSRTIPVRATGPIRRAPTRATDCLRRATRKSGLAWSSPRFPSPALDAVGTGVDESVGGSPEVGGLRWTR